MPNDQNSFIITVPAHPHAIASLDQRISSYSQFGFKFLSLFPPVYPVLFLALSEFFCFPFSHTTSTFFFLSRKDSTLRQRQQQQQHHRTSATANLTVVGERRKEEEDEEDDEEDGRGGR